MGIEIPVYQYKCRRKQNISIYYIYIYISFNAYFLRKRKFRKETFPTVHVNQKVPCYYYPKRLRQDMNQPAQSQTLANERNHHNATEVPLQAPQKDQFGIQWVGDFNQAIILEIKGIPRQAKSKKICKLFWIRNRSAIGNEI